MTSRDQEGRVSEDNDEMTSLIRGNEYLRNEVSILREQHGVLREQHAEADRGNQDLRSRVNVLTEQHAEADRGNQDLRSQVNVLREKHAEADQDWRNEVRVLREQHAQLEAQHVESERQHTAEVLTLKQQVESLTRMLALTSAGSGAAPVLRQEGGEAQSSTVTAGTARIDLYDSNNDDSIQQQIDEANLTHEDSPLFHMVEEGRGRGGLHGTGALAGGDGDVTVSPGVGIEGYGANEPHRISAPLPTEDYAPGEVRRQSLAVSTGVGGRDSVPTAPGGLGERTAAAANGTTPVQGTNNATEDETEQKAGFSLYDRDTNTHYPFQDSAIFFFITSNRSVEFMLAAMAVAVAVGIMVLAIIDAFEDGKEGNLLNIPAGVRAPVRAAQVFATIVGILSEQETYQGIALLKFAIKKSLHLNVDNERIQVKRWKVFFASFCFLTVGSLFLINMVVSVIRADEVISLFFDILALEFVLNVDNLIYGICKYFRLIKDATLKLKRLELDRPTATQSPRNWRLPFTTRAFLVKVLGVVAPLAVLCILQQVGKYTEKSIAVTFGDETWERAIVIGEDEPRVLLYSYFSGVYERDGYSSDGYARYVERNKENGNSFDDTVPAEIVYCPKLESWVFTHPNIYKSADQDEGNCNWLMRSSKTESFDIVEAAGDGWETWVGTIQTGTSLSIYSNECGSDEDCSFNGKCKNKKCVCNENEDGTPLFFGRQCQLEMPCGILVTENVERGSRTQLLMVESDTTNEGFLKTYGRPIYYVTGLSGVPEALLSINPKNYGHPADRSATELVVDTGNKAFEDDDFFRESLKEFVENPLEDTLFDFGGTKISLRNYAVILAFSGSRWFATIDRPDFNVKDLYNADYHAFWQNTYSDRTFLVSNPNSNGSPVGAEFFSPRRRKTGKDYGPFGILLPNSDIEGVGFFQCYVNVGKCTFVDINVSTQNKSLPTNKGDFFSADQIVSWKLESMEAGSNKVVQESPSVLLGAKFTHRYCLDDGSYMFSIVDEVCKASWWECQHGPGKVGYNISINDMPAMRKYDIFQESKFTFSVLQGGQEVQEDRNSNICSGFTNFHVTIFTDGSPYETSWYLMNDAYDSPLLEGGPYPFYNTFTTYDNLACLADGAYNFTIFDSGGDGMIPPGHYDLMVGDRYIVQAGHLFDSSRSTLFSIVGGSLSLVPGMSPSIPFLNKHYCSEVLFDVLGSLSTSSVPLSQNGIFWSLFDTDEQAHTVEAQPLNRGDPKAPCLYVGAYTFIFEHTRSECFGAGLSLFGASRSSILYYGSICQNNTFSFLVKNTPNEDVDEGGNETFTLTSLVEDCMNDFHLVVSDDVTKGTSDGSWELYGTNGMILSGDQFGNLSATYYSHHACLGPGTYNFITWKHPTSQYSVMYRRTTSSNVELDLGQLVSGGKRPIAIDNSDLSISWTDVGSIDILGKSSNSYGGGWIVEGSGAGIGERYDHTGNSDSFHYLHGSFSEDVGLTILVEKFSGNSNNQSRGGIMFRDTLDASSRHYSMFLTGQNELRTSYRRTCKGCETVHASNGANAGPNSIWLRVTKEGNWFTSYYKEGDSPEWNQLGSAEYICFSSEDFFVGIAVTSHDKTATATLEASYVELVALREVHEYALTLWEEHKLLPRDGAEGDRFGSAVALDESTLLIGAPLKRENGIGKSGSAYVFVSDNEGWREQVKLAPRDGRERSCFGWALALDGNTILIGAPNRYANRPESSAYVFIRDGADWRQQAKLVPHDGAGDDDFGADVALDGETIVIGAPYGYHSGSRSGSAYVFVRNGDIWTEQAKLVPHDGAYHFGSSVALSKDTILIGAPNGGSAYVFIRSSIFGIEVWKEHTKLAPHDGAAGALFGASVALNGDIAVIGAPRRDSGSAYVFVQDEEVWREHIKLLPRDGAPYDRFGYSVALSENIIIIGSPNSDANGDNIGSTHVFARRGEEWREVDKLLPHDGAQGDNFGHAVALDDDTLALTSPENNDNGADSGSAYTFTTPMSELIRAKTLPPLRAPSPSPPTSLASLSPTAYCVDVDFGISILTDNHPEDISWILSRIFNREGMIVREVFFQGSSLLEQQTLHNYTDVMCLERGDYQFSIYDSGGDGICCVYGDGYYSITLDGEVIARGGEFDAGETVPFTIPFIPSPSSLPSASLSPSQTPSASLVPSVSFRPTSFPSASSSPSVSPIPTSSWSPSASPSVSTAPTSCHDIEINIFTDRYPEETSWMLSRTATDNGSSSTDAVLEGSPGNKASHHSDAACLESGEYEFTIHDTHGNGICCAMWQGDGHYNITVGGEVIARGGEFQFEESVSFTIPIVPSPPPSISSSPSSSSYPSSSLSPSTSLSQVPSVSPSMSLSPSSSQVPSVFPSASLSPTCGFVIEIHIFSDWFPQQTRWTLWGTITVDGISSTELILDGSPTNKERHHLDSACLERGDYKFTIYDSRGDGIWWPGYYNITVGGKVIAVGGDFQDVEKVSFSIPIIQDTTVPTASSSEDTSAPEAGTGPIFIPTASPITSENPETRQPSASPMTSAAPSTPSPPDACHVVEVGISFNGSPVGSGWTIAPLGTADGAGAVGIPTRSFFPSEGSPADGGDVRSLCLGQGRYKLVVYDYIADGGVNDYYIKSNGEMIWRGGEFESTETVVFDIPYTP